jgi:8-amino-7-oxononanoate synthase
MAEVSKQLRQTRFNLKDDAPVRLVLETNTGTRIEARVTNCSFNGICALYGGILTPTDGFDLTSIIPSSKLFVGEQEIGLGRLAVRRIMSTETQTYLAFSTIDVRVPIDGAMSRYLDQTSATTKSPYEFELNPDKFSLASFVETSQTNIDLLHRTEQFQVFFKEWKNTKKFQYRTIRTASKGPRVNLKQLRKNRRNDYLVLGSNDYLGLASHPEVIEAAKKAIDEYGFGSTGSPVGTGTTDLHEELSHFIAKIFHKEDVMLYNSGYAANIGTIAGLTSAQDLILADMLSHASIQDGMQMSKATSRFFKHNDMTHLEKLLAENRNSHVGALIATEGVFSMDGDTAKLDEILALAQKYNTRTYLDEAHSLGVVGPTGLGLWETLHEKPVDIIMGTFSKICGGIGGFIATTEAVKDWLNFYGRSQVFSVSLPPSTAAAALKALQLFVSQPQLHANLKRNIHHFVSGLRDLGCPLAEDHPSAVIPVVIGDEDKLGKMNEVFRDEGVYVVPVIYPAVGKKNCRFRFTMMATHTISDLDYVLNVVEKAMLKADFQFQRKDEAVLKAA